MKIPGRFRLGGDGCDDESHLVPEAWRSGVQFVRWFKPCGDLELEPCGELYPFRAIRQKPGDRHPAGRWFKGEQVCEVAEPSELLLLRAEVLLRDEVLLSDERALAGEGKTLPGGDGGGDVCEVIGLPCVPFLFAP